MESNVFLSIRYEVQVYDDDDVSTWFTNAIGRPCNLLRCSSTSDYVCLTKNGSVDSCSDAMTRLNFTNEAQILLMSEKSLSDLNTRINSGSILSFVIIVYLYLSNY